MLYKIIEAYDVDLVDFVQEDLDDGWELLGPPVFVRMQEEPRSADGPFPFFAQALTKSESESDRDLRQRKAEAQAEAIERRRKVIQNAL